MANVAFKGNPIHTVSWSGGALLLASVIAGGLWNAFGAPATFLTGAVFAAVAALGLLLPH